MYAIVKFKGKMLKVSEGAVLNVPYLANLTEGDEVEMNRVLMLRDTENRLRIGAPVVAGVSVKAEVVEHGREKKIIVFRKKRRKGFARKQGHRQHYTKVRISGITE